MSEDTRVDVLAFGAHPDDVELTCAGTLVKMKDRGHRIAVVDMTRGEMGSRGTREIRDQESRNSSVILGLHGRQNLELPDAGLVLDPPSLKKAVTALRELRPRLVIAPHPQSIHPDHVECSRIVRRAAFLSGLARFDAPGDAHKPDRVLFAMYRLEFRPTFVVDVTDQFERRLDAIRCYRSQLFDPAQEDGPATDIARTDFLDRIVTRAKYYGGLIGAEYGEPFQCLEMMEIDDPFETFTAFKGLPGRGLI